MLARASSDAGTRLRRSKSTSTVHRHPPPIVEPLDPDLAKQQAIAAATAAFARAQVHDVAEQKPKRSSEVFRSKSNASRKSLTSKGQGSHFPTRESSFRCLHPPPKAGQDNTSQRQSQSSTMNTEKFPSFYRAPSIIDRPLSAQPSIAFSERSRSSPQPKASHRSATSSITSQQIRKARSMYYASSVQTGSPIARPPAKYLTTPPPVTVTPTLEVPAALLLNRTVESSPLAAPCIPVIVSTNESVDKARDKYLQTFQDRSVKHKPSLFIAPFMKRQDRGKDKSKSLSSGFTSVSASNQRTPNETTADITLNDFLPQPDKKDKRSFSGSLKSRIKRVFRRTSKTSTNLPVQQIEASRDYFSSGSVDVQDVRDFYGIPSPDETILQRARDRTPSLEGSRLVYHRSTSRTSSNGSLRSNRSLHSEANASNPSTSRVTSWGTTSTGDTLTQRAMKRLTVIHEAKDSIGSEADRIASMSTKRKSLPVGAIGALAAFRDPMPMESLLEESSIPVDPKRVFSALMKEIGTSNPTDVTLESLDRTPGAESDVFESSKTKSLHASGREVDPSASIDFRPSTATDQRPPSRRPPSAAAHSVQSKTSSIRTLGRALRSTIRTVTPGEHWSSPCSGRPIGILGAMHSLRDNEEMLSSSPTFQGEDCITFNASVLQQERHAEVFSPSAAQIEKRVERAKERWKSPLDDAEKLQFPRETDRMYNVANFSQRVGSDELTPTTIEQAKALQNEPQLAPEPPTPSPRPLMSPLSPSIYSRNTDGISILPNDSVMSFNGATDFERQHNGGSAVILTSGSVRSFTVGTPSPRHHSSCRAESPRFSRDWKAWLSHEVSSMEFTGQEDLQIHERYTTPSGKHYREVNRTSHTEQDDTTVILRSSCDTVTAFVDPDAPMADDGIHLEEVEEARVVPEDRSGSPSAKPSVFEKSQSHTDTFKEVTPENTPPIYPQTHARKVLSRPGSTPILSRPRMPSSRSHAPSVSQPLIETPILARMNERFPYIVKTRRSSNNSSKSSRQSKSPPESLASSLKSTRATSSPRIYSDLSVPRTIQMSHRLPNIASERSEAQQMSKENETPPSTGASKNSKRPNVLSLGLASRPKSTQPLATIALSQNTTDMSQYATNIPEIKHAKHNSSPAATPARIRVRASVRSISPEKLSRRPKSAFDLRGTRTPLPRPTPELRRPAVHLKSSTNSLALSREPSPGTEDRVIDSILEEGERSCSTTPGQRMVDQFLRQRKSTGVLEGGRHRGGLRLVREDTPAFL